MCIRDRVYFVSYYDYYQPEAYVPSSDTFIEKDASINEEVEKLRHAATSALLSRRDCIVVASVSCIYGIGSPMDYAGMAVFVDKQKDMDRDQVIHELIDIQYDRNDYEQDVYKRQDLQRERISLGLKQTTEDPWVKLVESYPVGTICLLYTSRCV